MSFGEWKGLSKPPSPSLVTFMWTVPQSTPSTQWKAYADIRRESLDRGAKVVKHTWWWLNS